MTHVGSTSDDSGTRMQSALTLAGGPEAGVPVDLAERCRDQIRQLAARYNGHDFAEAVRQTV
jgi:hypothetical protein